MVNGTSGRQRWRCALESPTGPTWGTLGWELGLTWAPWARTGITIWASIEAGCRGCNLLLAWGDQADGDRGHAAGCMKALCDEEQGWNWWGSSTVLLLPLALSCPFSPPVRPVAYVWVGFSPEKAFISVGKRPKLIPFCYNLQQPRELFHAKGNSVHPPITPSEPLAPFWEWQQTPHLCIAKLSPQCSVFAREVVLGSTPLFLGSAPHICRNHWTEIPLMAILKGKGANLAQVCWLKC